MSNTSLRRTFSLTPNVHDPYELYNIIQVKEVEVYEVFPPHRRLKFSYVIEQCYFKESNQVIMRHSGPLMHVISDNRQNCYR